MFNVKKKFFKRDLKRAQAEIWNLEFGIFSIKVGKEAMRKEYDQTQDALQRVEAQAKSQPNDKKLQKEKERMEMYKKQLKKELDFFDRTLNGCQPDEEYPEGIQAVTEQLKAKVQKKKNLENFIKLYC